MYNVKQTTSKNTTGDRVAISSLHGPVLSRALYSNVVHLYDFIPFGVNIRKGITQFMSLQVYGSYLSM